jgi:hypothetical protein
MNTKKSQFLSAVRILALNDSVILNLAQRVPEAELPDFPGAAALLFVTALSNLRQQERVSPARVPIRRGTVRRVGCRRLIAPAARPSLRHVCS